MAQNFFYLFIYWAVFKCYYLKKKKYIKTFTFIHLADTCMQSMSQNDLRLTNESYCDVEVFSLSGFEAVMTELLIY